MHRDTEFTEILTQIIQKKGLTQILSIFYIENTNYIEILRSEILPGLLGFTGFLTTKLTKVFTKSTKIQGMPCKTNILVQWFTQ